MNAFHQLNVGIVAQDGPSIQLIRQSAHSIQQSIEKYSYCNGALQPEDRNI
jgi:hypothetical protein